MRIEGKVAVITGAASGIGEATALELAKRGAKRLALADRNDRVVQVAHTINGAVRRPAAEAFIGDATDATFRAQLFDQIAASPPDRRGDPARHARHRGHDRLLRTSARSLGFWK